MRRNRTKQTLWRTRGAKRRAEFHHCLIPVAGRVWVEQAVRFLLQRLPFFRLAQIAANCAETRKHARYVSVEHGGAVIEGDAGDCGRGVVANSGKRKNLFAFS